MFRLVDLFCGAGGLTLGAKRAGFVTELAIDKDPILSSSFTTNFPSSRLVLSDLANLGAADLRALVPRHIDGVIGGPPCQAFSSIGRHVKNDPRRDLVGAFFRVISVLRPSFFLMENVRGLSYSGNIRVLHSAIDKLEGDWSILGPLILDAADFGAPTARQRLFVLGFNSSRMDVPAQSDFLSKSKMRTTVRDAIADLSNAKELSVDERGFDCWQYSRRTKLSDYALQMRSPLGCFTGHRRTVHTNAVVRRFTRLQEGGIDPIGRHPRLAWGGQCPTLRAGTGSDRGSFQSVRPIHPSEQRVITAREAARLQGFPDDFLFHPTIWHSFRMIGNSVSPIIAEAILRVISGCLKGGIAKSAAE